MLKVDFNPPRKQLAQFGLIALFGFPLIGFVIRASFDLPWTVFYVLLGVGIATFAASLIDAQLVRPVFIGLMLIAIPIGLVISFTMMVLIYYLLFTPVGLIFRLFGRDPLVKRPDASLPTYWHVREEPRGAASYLRLY